MSSHINRFFYYERKILINQAQNGELLTAHKSQQECCILPSRSVFAFLEGPSQCARATTSSFFGFTRACSPPRVISSPSRDSVPRRRVGRPQRWAPLDKFSWCIESGTSFEGSLLAPSGPIPFEPNLCRRIPTNGYETTHMDMRNGSRRSLYDTAGFLNRIPGTEENRIIKVFKSSYFFHEKNALVKFPTRLLLYSKLL